MKIVAVFLSLYIVLLCCIPCADVNGDDSGKNTELFRNTTHNHQNDPDHCSPFCTCQCCQATFYFTSPPKLTLTVQTGIKYHDNTPDFQSTDLFDFLIPPKA